MRGSAWCPNCTSISVGAEILCSTFLNIGALELIQDFAPIVRILLSKAGQCADAALTFVVNEHQPFARRDYASAGVRLNQIVKDARNVCFGIEFIICTCPSMSSNAPLTRLKSSTASALAAETRRPDASTTRERNSEELFVGNAISHLV